MELAPMDQYGVVKQRGNLLYPWNRKIFYLLMILSSLLNKKRHLRDMELAPMNQYRVVKHRGNLLNHEILNTTVCLSSL